MKAWITLLSSKDYLPAVLVLKKSFDNTKTKFSFVVGVVENIATQEILNLLEKNGCIIEIIPKIEYNDFIKNKYKNHNVLFTASKIGLFFLKQYEKLVYIDADCIVYQNMDELFDKKDGSILYYKNDHINGLETGMSALFVFCPKNHFHKEYIKMMNAIDAFDGDFIGKTWFHIRDNPEYKISSCYLMPTGSNKKAKAYHLAEPKNKLWLFPEPKFKKSQIEIDYYKLLKEINLTNPELLNII